jgi:hypothetical protein
MKERMYLTHGPRRRFVPFTSPPPCAWLRLKKWTTYRHRAPSDEIDLLVFPFALSFVLLFPYGRGFPGHRGWVVQNEGLASFWVRGKGPEGHGILVIIGHRLGVSKGQRRGESFRIAVSRIVSDSLEELLDRWSGLRRGGRDGFL